MAISNPLVQINGTTVPGLKRPGGYKVVRGKLWSEAGRNMAGELKANFIGIFPKITLNFRHLTSAEMSTVITLLDNPRFTLAWFDEKSNTVKTGEYYAGDWDISLFDRVNERYEPFSVSLIPWKKLS